MKINVRVIFIIACIVFGVGSYCLAILDGRDVCESKGGTYLQGFYKMECIHQTKATIKDQGCNTHIDIPAPKNQEIKDTYKMENR